MDELLFLCNLLTVCCCGKCRTSMKLLALALSHSPLLHPSTLQLYRATPRKKDYVFLLFKAGTVLKYYLEMIGITGSTHNLDWGQMLNLFESPGSCFS